ncbi:MAG TPA: C4-dicarboxylate ABC transporter, partial [Xanthomonadaceae bacterium]|nr:C4-dicarboxylate ABC transporter [Xanthomonadaceae bacterium]
MVMLVLLLLGLCAGLASGLPVAFVIGGVALLVAGLGTLLGSFDPVFLQALPNRLFDTLTSQTLLAVPLFVFMGVMLERSRLAEALLTRVAALFGQKRGGLAVAAIVGGAIGAASTGIVGPSA